MRPLVIRYRKLGDSLMATPILRALAERGEVFAVGESAYERAFTGAGTEGFLGLGGGEPSRLELVRAGLAARRFRCDTALVLRFNRRASIVARLAGCRVRVGGTRSQNGLLTGLTHNAYDPATWPTSNQVEKYYAVAEMGCGPLERVPTAYPATPMAGMPPVYVVVHLGNGGSNAPWPDASFEAVVEGLQGTGTPVVASGDPLAYPRACAASDVSLAGRTDLDALADLFAGARAVVGLDGGGPRLAAAVGTPVVVLAAGDRWSAHQASPWMSLGTVLEAPLDPERVVGEALALAGLEPPRSWG